MPVTADLEQAGDLTVLLDLAGETGEVVLLENGTPVARFTTLAPTDASPTSRPRVAGLHRGSVTISDEFDEPLPDSFWSGDA